MVSHTRSVSSRSRSARNGGASSNRSNASHSAPKPQNHGSHRANGPKKKQNKRKHLVLKWVLGIFAALLAVENGYQAALMAPTEILARQHYEGLSPLLEGLGVRCALLTGSMTAKTKRTVSQQLAAATWNQLCVANAADEIKAT